MIGIEQWIIAGMLLAGSIPVYADGSPQKVYRRVLPSVLTLEVENAAGERYIGSGVVALGDDLAVTAWHVVHDARSVWAVFADGHRLRATGCVDKNERRDLALIKLENRVPHRQATLAKEMAPIAARAYVIGAPKGYSFSISDGLISQIRDVDGFAHYQISCPISPGNSGGPVTNERGEVIGITSWTKADAQNLSFAVPVRELTVLDKTRLPVPWGNLDRAVSPTRPSASAKPSRMPVMPLPATVPGGNLESMKDFFEHSVGKSVRVTIQCEGQDDEFKFTVPPTGLK